MKNITKTIGFLLVILSSSAYSQVVIGGDTGSAGTNTSSVLLDFVAGENKGLIVPYVRTMPTASPTMVGGAILLDASTPTTARVKYYNAGTSSWVDLSGQDADISTLLTATQPTGITETDSKAIIGAATSSADGVLVLESTTKAMVLPIVADVQDIPSPSPGMVVYVNKTGAKRLAVYNGSKWSFWMP